MTTYTTKLGLARLVEGQNSAEVTINTNENVVDLFAGGAIEILDRDLATAPASPSDGDAYIINGTPAGDWASAKLLDGTTAVADGDIVVYVGGWIGVSPAQAMQAFVVDEKIWIGYSSVESEWHPIQKLWSSSEYWTGKYNGSSKVYCKAFTGITGPTALATVNTAHSITGLDLAKRVEFEICWYHNAGSMAAFPAPSNAMNHTVDGTNVILTDIASIDWSAFRADIRLEYCKT